MSSVFCFNFLLASVLCASIGSACPVFAQQRIEAAQKRFAPNPWENVNGWRFGAAFRKDLEAEISYILSSYPRSEQGYGGLVMPIHNISAGLEYVKHGKQHAAGAKISYEFSILAISTQLGTDILVSDKDYQLRMMPKIGITAFGIFTAYYTYNWNIRERSALRPASHQISVQCNLYDILVGDGKPN